MTVIASMAVPTDTLAGSDGPLLEVVQVGPLAMNTKVFSAIALFALVNGALAAVLVVVGDLETLADTTVLLLLFAFIAVHVSVLVLGGRRSTTSTSARGRRSRCSGRPAARP